MRVFLQRGNSNKAHIFTDSHQREQVDQKGDQVAETVTRIDFVALIVVIESARICPLSSSKVTALP